MSVAKVIEIISEGKSVEDAIEKGVKEVAKTVDSIQGVWVDNIQALVKNQKIAGFRVNLKVTFVVNK